jgi:hypothetical protein
VNCQTEKAQKVILTHDPEALKDLILVTSANRTIMLSLSYLGLFAASVDNILPIVKVKMNHNTFRIGSKYVTSG